MSSFPALLAEVRACTLCAAHLPHGVRPIVQITPSPRSLLSLKKNPWFEAACIPKLRKRVAKALAT